MAISPPNIEVPKSIYSVNQMASSKVKPSDFTDRESRDVEVKQRRRAKTTTAAGKPVPTVQSHALPTAEALEHYMRSPGSNQSAMVNKLHALARHAKQIHRGSFANPSGKVNADEDIFAIAGGERQVKRPHTFWRDKHVFAELDELRGDTWCHTHRWKFGLEEKAITKGAINSNKTVWGKPQIPLVSLYGLSQILERLSNFHILLDVPGFTYRAAITNIIDKAIRRKIFPMEARLEVINMLCRHEKRNPDEEEEGGRNSGELGDGNPGSASRRSSLDDVLQQEYADEALLIKVAEGSFMKYRDMHDGVPDEFESDHRIILFARLDFAVDVGMDVKNARFLVIVLGVDKPEARQLDIEIGGSFAALMQDEHICCSAYTSVDSTEFRYELEKRVHTIKMVPEIHRPTQKGIKKREIRLGRELSALAQTSNQWAKWEARQMMEPRCDTFSHFIKTATTYAMPLLLGILLAMIWANVAPENFQHWLGPGHHAEDAYSTNKSHINKSEPLLVSSRRMLLGTSGSSSKPTFLNLHYKHDVTINFIVNDVFMCFFFGLAVKEITEALSPGGSMHPPHQKAINPLLGTFGGVAGPVAVFFLLTALLHSLGFYPEDILFDEVANGWGIPTATDISLAWVTAFFVFGSGHPAILYLLLLAIVDDGLGLIIIAVAYPDKSQTPNYAYLGLLVLAMVLSYTFRKLNFMNWKLYIFVAGPIAWFGLMECSLHPALALCFVVPFLPNDVHTEEEGSRQSKEAETNHEHVAPLHAFEHDLKPFVDIVVMFSFGLVNGGVEVKYIGPLSGTIFVSLVVGKTLGIGLMSFVGEKIGYPAPPGISLKDCFMIGFIASIGLTVALFVSGVAYPNSPLLEGEAKMGAVLSIASAIIAIVVSKTCCSFENKMKKKLQKEKSFNNVDIDSDSDDEEIDRIMVKSVVGTIRNVEKTKKKMEEIAGMKTDVLLDEDRKNQLSASLQKIKSTSSSSESEMVTTI